jgi:hypothetical protein
MKLDSKYFDCIRVKRGQEQALRPDTPGCQFKGCQAPGLHRAPMGRGREGQYYRLCLDHVRQFNSSYNYFQGMSNSEVEAYQKDSVIGHRPTWKVGANSWAHGTPYGISGKEGGVHTGKDPHGFFPWRAQEGAETKTRHLKPLEKKALQALNLSETAEQLEIKARFKELVKRHHPDANGGDKRSEEKLREIIQAYNYLKQAGLV